MSQQIAELEDFSSSQCGQSVYLTARIALVKSKDVLGSREMFHPLTECKVGLCLQSFLYFVQFLMVSICQVVRSVVSLSPREFPSN